MRVCGAVGGPFSPSEQTYTITSRGDNELHWGASYSTSDGGRWLRLNGEETAEGVIVESNGTDQVVVAICNSVAAGLEHGVYFADVMFDDLDFGAKTVREVVLKVGQGEIDLSMAAVTEQVSQPGGPEYGYRIGIYEVTNARFAGFLNHAMIHGDDARGRLYV